MKQGIHPVYRKSVVTCVCGNTFVTRSTAGDLKLEICSNCHPFFTGKQKLVDSAGRVEKFMKNTEKRLLNKPSFPRSSQKLINKHTEERTYAGYRKRKL